MATRLRQDTCRHCGEMMMVPLEEQTIYCSYCGGVTILQRRFNANARTYRPEQPWEGGTVYVRPLQMQMPMPMPMPMQPSPPPAYGKKRALLCGITYKGHKKSIKGSINDVLLMRSFLIKRGFPTSSILLLTEEERDPSRIPTKKNIQAALRWLVQGCRSGDSLVFHYSGHGSSVRDRNGDEVDGYDESLLPEDYETEGRILDDEINETIVRPLTPGVTLHAIIDTCFSGTFLDLPYVCKINSQGGYKWIDHQRHIYRGTNGGRAISISACDDHQNSGEATVFAGRPTGALTYSFVKTLEQEPKLSYGHLLTVMHERIRKAQQKVGLTQSEAPQEPKLSASQAFSIYRTPFAI